MAHNDEKVVSLKFDNAQFERNIKQSMNSLDEFDKQCEKVGKNDASMSGLQKAFSQTEMMATEAGFHIRDVWLKMSTVLEYQIARRIVNTGKKIADALTMEGVRDGLSEYEMQMNSVQTIMANTGASVQTVNKYLDELNEYADKTIYNFSQMTRNIGLFTAAGVGLKESTNAIKGIANLAAVSGSDSTKASMAMYQLSQALATGTVRLQDWNSVVNAGMGGKVFQNALIRTSEIMGTGAEEAIKKYGNFRDSLTKGAWLTSEVLSETLAQIAGAYSEAELIEKGYTAEQVQDIMELAKVAEGAATNVKTFTQLIDTVKEAIGSGWALSFRTVVGDFEEAKDLWTKVSKIINAAIDKQSDARNEMLQSWKDMGGRKDVINTFINLYNAVNRVIIPIKEAWNDIFGWKSGALQLKSITGAIEKFTDKLKLSGHQMLQVRKIFTAIFTTARTLISVFKSVATSILRIFTPILPAGNSVLDILGAIADKVTDVNNAIAKSGAIERLGAGIGKAFSFVTKTLTDVLVLVLKVLGYVAQLPIVQRALNAVGNTLLGIVNYISKVVDALASGKNILEAINLEGIVDFLGRILYIIGLIAGTIAGGIINGIKSLGSAISGLFKSGDKVDKVDTIEKTFEPLLGSNNGGIVQEITKTADAVKKEESTFKKIATGIKGAFSVIQTAVSSLWEYLKGIDINETLTSLLNTLKIAASLYIAWKTAKAIISLANAIDNVSEILEERTKSISIANIRNLATAIFLMAAAFGVLVMVPTDKILQASLTLAGVMVAFGIFSKVMNKLDISGSVPKMSATLLALSTSILMMAGVITIFSKLSSSKNARLKSGVLALGAVFAEILGLLTGVTLLKKFLTIDLKGISSFLMGLGFSLLELAGVIALFAVLPQGAYILGLSRMTSVLGILVSYIVIIEYMLKSFTSMAGVAATIMAFASSLLIVIGAMHILANMKDEVFDEGLKKVRWVLLTLIAGIAGLYFAIMGIAKLLNSTLNFEAVKISAALLAFGSAILMMTGSLVMLSNVKTERLKTAETALLKIMIVMAVILGVLSRLMVDPFTSAASNMVKVAVAMGIIALGMNLIVPSLIVLAALNEIDMWAAAAAVGEICAVMLSIAAVLYAMNKGTSALKTRNLLALVAVVASIAVGVTAIMAVMNDFKDLSKLGVALIGLIGVLSAIALIAKMSTSISEGAGQGLFALALAIVAFMGPLYVMKDMAWEQITAGLIGMSAAILAMAGALAILKKFGGGFKEAGIIIALSAAFLVLAAALRVLESVEWDTIWKGLTAVAAALGLLLLGGFIAHLGPVAAGLAVLTAALVAILTPAALFTVAIAALNVAISLLVTTIAEYGPAMNEALTNFFNIIITNAPLAGLAFTAFASQVALGLLEIAAAAVVAGPLIIAGLVAGIIGGIPTATNSMKTLDNAMINQFTSDWAIASPSGLMAAFGAYMIQGLAQGLNSGDATTALSDMSKSMDDSFRSYWQINSPSGLMKTLGGYLVSGLGMGIADKAGDAVLEATILGGNVKDGVEAGGVNWLEGYNLGQTFGGGTLQGIQDLLASYGLSLDMITGSSATAQLEKAQARQAEIAKENKDAWNEYKEAMEAYGEGSVAADMAKQNWLDTVDANADENWQLTQTIKNLEEQIELEEKAAVAAEEQAASEAEIAKMTSNLTDEQLAALSVEETARANMLYNQRERLEALEETAKTEYARLQLAYDQGKATKEEVETAKQAWEYEVGRLEENQRLLDELLGTEEEAVETTEDLADAMGDVGSGASKSKEEVEDMLDSIQSLLDEYAEAWVSKRDEIFGNFNPFEAVEMDTNEVGSVDDMLKNLKTQIDRNASWGAVQESFYNRLEAVGAAVGNEAGADLAQDWLEGLSADSTEEIRALVNASDEELAQFIQMWSDAYGQAGHLANIGLLKTKEDTEEKLAEMLDVVSIRLEDVVNVFDGTVESVMALQELANNDWYQKIINNVPLISDDVKDALEDGWSLEQLMTFGESAVDNVNQALLTAVENQQDALTETGSELGTAMIDGVAQEFEDGSKSLASAEESMVSALADPADGALLALKESLEIGSPSQVWAREIGWWIFMGVMQGLWNIEDAAEHEEVLAQCMLAMITYAKEWVDTFGMEKLHAIGVKMTNYIVDNVGGMQSGVPVQNLKSCMDNLSEIACTQLESHKDDFYEVGVNLIQGLIDGMGSMETQLINTAVSLAEAASVAAKTALGEASPSKLWATFGVYAVEGLILGMESQETNLEVTAEDIVNRANETASMIANTLALAMADSDYEPTITPVVDLSEIQNGAYLAGKMWDQSPAANLSAIVRGNEMEARRAAQYEADQSDPTNAANGGVTFVQNNYSPKALSRLDIYRDTKKELHQLKGALNRR